MSGLRDILELQKRQHSRYNALRNDILRKMSDKIRHLSKHGELRCVYSVPSYTFGFPVYNVAEITTYLFTILKNEGFIKDFKINKENNKSLLSLELKYHSGNPVISTFERVSKPGRRIFSSADGLPKINNGLGIAIVSTPKGVMTDIDARKQRVGGEIICKVF